MTIFHSYWKYNEAHAVEFLDTISESTFKELCEEGQELRNIRDSLENNLENKFQEMYPGEELFDAIDSDELEEYLETRFGWHFKEVSYRVLHSYK